MKCRFHKWHTVPGLPQKEGKNMQQCLDCGRTRYVTLKRWHPTTECKGCKPRTSLKRTGPLKHMSKDKTDWVKMYVLAKAADALRQMCAKCGRFSVKTNMEPHHPFGRMGERIMMYLWMHIRFHREDIHQHEKQARVDGWLQPEFDSRPHNADTPKPWRKVLGGDPWIMPLDKPSQSTDTKTQRTNRSS